MEAIISEALADVPHLLKEDKLSSNTAYFLYTVLRDFLGENEVQISNATVMGHFSSLMNVIIYDVNLDDARGVSRNKFEEQLSSVQSVKVLSNFHKMDEGFEEEVWADMLNDVRTDTLSVGLEQTAGKKLLSNFFARCYITLLLRNPVRSSVQNRIVRFKEDGFEFDFSTTMNYNNISHEERERLIGNMEERFYQFFTQEGKEEKQSTRSNQQARSDSGLQQKSTVHDYIAEQNHRYVNTDDKK